MTLQMTYGRNARLRKPAEVRFDRFSIFHIGREHNLAALDCWVLDALARLCDWRTGDWSGTITELADDVRATRRAVGTSLKRLKQETLIQEIAPFGPKIQGTLRVLALPKLLTGSIAVVPADPRAELQPHLHSVRSRNRADKRETTPQNERGNRAPTAHQPRGNRAPIAPNGAISVALTCDDALAQGNQGRRGEGAEESRDNVVATLQRDFAAEVIAERSADE